MRAVVVRSFGGPEVGSPPPVAASDAVGSKATWLTEPDGNTFFLSEE